jgi:hypothetical protein
VYFRVLSRSQMQCLRSSARFLGRVDRDHILPTIDRNIPLVSEKDSHLLTHVKPAFSN